MRFSLNKLENGIRVLSIPLPEHETVTVLVLVAAGSKYETKGISGISHFLEHLSFKGTTRRPSAHTITHELDALGTSYNAFTAQEYTGYYVKGLTRHAEKFFDVLSDIFIHSTFPIAEIERERGVILDEMNMYEDLPARNVWHLFYELLYGDQPAGWRILGERNVIQKLTRDDIASYQKAHYVPGSTFIVVSGGVTGAQANRYAKKYFGSMVRHGKPLTKKAVIEHQRAAGFQGLFKKTDQTHMILGVRTVSVDHRLAAVCDLAAGVLGGGMSSRLFQKIREEMGVGYYVRANHETYTDHGYLAASVGVDPKRAVEVLAAVRDEFRRMTMDLVPSSELNKVKEYIAGNLFMGLETCDAVSEFYGIQALIKKKIQSPKEVVQELRAISASDIKSVSRAMMTSSRLNCALIGPHKDHMQFATQLSL